jgi:uncharacterized protein YndB with AHSA1/START domain
MRVQDSIEIAAAPEKIWPFLVEPDRILKWYTLLQKFEYTSQQRSGVGTTFYMEEKGGVLMKLNFLATEWVENQVLAFRMTSGNFVKAYEQKWSLAPSAAGTLFTCAEDVTMPYGALGRILGAMVRSSSKAHMREMVVRLKALAEA